MPISLTRRNILKAVGFASLAAVPVFRRGILHADTTSGPPRRFIANFVFDGTRPESFWPDGTADLPSSPTEAPLPPGISERLAPIDAFRDELLVIKGMDNEASVQPGGSHTRGMLTGLSGFFEIEEHDPNHGAGGGPTIDHLLDEAFGDQTRFSSLQLGVIPRYGKISWRGALDYKLSNPDPYAVFDMLFGEPLMGPDPREVERVRRRRASVLDHVSGDLTALSSQLATAERERLGAHLESIRSMERRLAPATESGAACVPPTIDGRLDIADYANVPALGQLQMDLAVAAFACDLTRTITLQWGKGTSTITFPWLGIEETHHDLSHSTRSETELRDKLLRADLWFMEQFAYLLGKMDAVVESNGSTLLDNSLAYWLSEVGNGSSHSVDLIPQIIAGSAGGRLRPGRFLRYPSRAHNDLLLSILHAMGLEELDCVGSPELCRGPLPLLS